MPEKLRKIIGEWFGIASQNQSIKKANSDYAVANAIMRDYDAYLPFHTPLKITRLKTLLEHMEEWGEKDIETEKTSIVTVLDTLQKFKTKNPNLEITHWHEKIGSGVDDIADFSVFGIWISYKKNNESGTNTIK